jgi:hypothetical protein
MKHIVKAIVKVRKHGLFGGRYGVIWGDGLTYRELRRKKMCESFR